jgi:hypothetical protein
MIYGNERSGTANQGMSWVSVRFRSIHDLMSPLVRFETALAKSHVLVHFQLYILLANILSLAAWLWLHSSASEVEIYGNSATFFHPSRGLLYHTQVGSTISPCSWVLFKKLIVAQLLKRFYNDLWNFIGVFTLYRRWSRTNALHSSTSQDGRFPIMATRWGHVGFMVDGNGIGAGFSSSTSVSPANYHFTSCFTHICHEGPELPSRFSLTPIPYNKKRQ